VLRTETRPTGEVITRTPDAAGRLDTIEIPGGLLDYDYYPPGTPSCAGKTSDIRGPYGVDLHYTYDGSLTTSTTWSDDVSGSVWHDQDRLLSYGPSARCACSLARGSPGDITGPESGTGPFPDYHWNPYP